MKFRKIAVICVTAILLTGCNGISSESEFSNDRSSTSQTESSKLSVSCTDSSTDFVPVIEPEEFKQTGTITETVLYDRNNVKITATGLTYNNYDAELELNIENNSDTDLSIRSGTMAYCCNSVNGYMVDMGYLNCEVAAGKKANDTIKFSYSSLRMYRINEIADIEIGFDIDSADIFDDEFEKIYTGPCSVRTSPADSYNYSENTFCKAMGSAVVQGEFRITLNYLSNDKLCDNNGISAISEIIATNKNGDKVLFLEVENRTSEEVIDIPIKYFQNRLKKSQKGGIIKEWKKNWKSMRKSLVQTSSIKYV